MYTVGCLLGIYILVSGDDILKVLSVLFGILLMFDGFHSTVYAWVYARRAGKKGGVSCSQADADWPRQRSGR